MEQVELMLGTLRFALIFFSILILFLRILIRISFNLLKLLLLMFAWGTMFPGTRFAK
uniref:hypothetical protein n=1 Tax=Lactococcus garvieae TaxID=1363 RepID=UPI00359C1276